MQAQGGYWSKALEYRLQVFILINPILRYLTMQFQLHIIETDAEEELAALADMGKGQEMSRKPRGQVLMNPGLPHRRYSVPETVMRKYALTKQQSGSSDSGVATVPVATPDTLQQGSSSDETTAGTSSPDSSNHNKMGNIAAKGTGCTGQTESTTSNGATRSTLHTVSEETSETVSENCTESNSEPMSSAQTLLEESSFRPRKSTSPQNIGDYQPQTSMQNYLLATSTAMGDSKPPSKPRKGTEQKPSSITASTERQSSLKDDLSSSQTMGLESTDSRSSSCNKEAHQSPQNISVSVATQISVKSDLTHILDVESTDSVPETSNKELRNSLNTEGNVEREQSVSSENKYAGNSSSSTEGTMGTQTSSRIDTSSSQTMGLASTESRSSTTPDRVLATSGPSSKSIISTPEVLSQVSTETPDSGMTHCSPPGRNANGTPAECCITTTDPGQSHSLSSASDRASQSCSITPMESSVSASSPERSSVPVQSVVSSVSPPSSDHTVSTQDTTLSVKSDSTVLSRPVSVNRGCTAPVVHEEETRLSDSEQSIGHIEFMNDSKYNESRPTVNTRDRLTTSPPAEPNPQQSGDCGHITEPNCNVGEASLNKNQNKAETSDNNAKSTLNTQVSRKQVSTNTEFADCRYQSRSWEIIIHPTIVQPNLSKCPDDGVYGTKSKVSGNKMSVLPSKKQDLEFCGSKTCVVLRPSGTTMVPGSARLSGTSTYPPTKCRSSPGNQPLTRSHEAEVFTSIVSPSRTEDMGPYGWSRLTEEEYTVQLQLHRQRLWMNRKISAANALPISPMHGPISSCVGTGSTYRKSQDTQLVVPRYSALPRSASMLVNTSSEGCSSNSNSDSDCLSLADSLEERPSSCTGRHKPTKYDSKLVRGDIVQLLPDERNHKHNLHRRISAATPRGKGKAFFVSMETGLDEVGTIKVDKNIDRQVISQSMPVRLKQKLSQRHQQMNLKKKRKTKTMENRDGRAETKQTKTEQEKSIGAEVETNRGASLQQIAGTENKDDPTQTSRETKSQGEAKATETSAPIRGICKKSSELPPHVRSLSTAIRHTAAQSSTGGGTFILSRNEDQGQTEHKSPQQATAEAVKKFSGAGNMLKKQQMPKELNPPVKQLKVSTHKTPLQNNHDTQRQEECNISRNDATMLQEKKHEEQSPMLKPSYCLNNHAIVHNERKVSEEETGVKIGNAAGNGNKEHDTHKNEVECAVQVSTDVQENTEPVNERSNVEVEENVITKEHETEAQEHSVKTANGLRRKMQKWHISPKESNTNNSSKTGTNELKYEDQKLPVKTSLSDMSTQAGDKTTNAQKLNKNGEGPSEETPSPERGESVLNPPETLESKKPKVPQKQPENFEKVLQHTLKAQKSDNGVESKEKVQAGEVQQVKTAEAEHVKTDEVQHVKIEHEHGRKLDIIENKEPGALKNSPEKKSLNTVSSQTSPEHTCEEKKRNSASNTDPNSNTPELPPDQIKNLIRPQLPLKSSIPIMKSPISSRKLSPDTVIMFQQSPQNSHLPVRTPRLQAQIRRSTNFLGSRFHQRFEVIPEERSVSIESSTEDQSWLTTDRSLRTSLPAGQARTKVSTGTPLGSRSNIVSHSCLGLNQTAITYKQNRHTAPNSETSSSNHEEGSNGNVRATNSDLRRKVIRRPTCQSRISKVEKLKKQSRIPEDIVCEGHGKRMDYQGKAALAPHMEDNDLVTLSKGWLNFYLLKDGCGTPDSSCEEAPTELSDKEKGKSSKKCPTLPKTVTVVGGDDNRIRQYTVQHCLPQQKGDKDKPSLTTLPELTSNSSSRRPSVVSVDKLPVAVLKTNGSAPDSDHSTTYICLPSPYLNVNSLLEGSGELACSESSVLSSSDSENERATSPAMLPVRRPTRQFRRGAQHQLSRSQIKHCKPEQFQSNSQSGRGGIAEWTVTVAGTNACPQQPPELEMHLSFPSCARQPGTSQSDSGLGEDNNGDKSKPQEHEAHNFLPPAQSVPQPHRWTLTVKSPGGSESQHEVPKSAKQGYQGLPDLGHNSSESKSSRKAIQRPESCFPMTSIAAQDTRKSKKFSRLWPKVKKILESKVIIRKSSGHVSQEVKSVSQLLENDDGGIVLRSGLAIQGSAITPEKKPRVPTMSEKDLTRSHTAKH
ncbi:hypothetical protein Cfor_07787 [Coptotermes formosanus]|uniref:Uncharacterized protein n=1 Tax=Coptotermes formosanus TaxID=36987 RepID=A0A6L2PJS6_COPFO|nr:hypothetical protein Cfor_07787 [Coptotermes formosanus]